MNWVDSIVLAVVVVSAVSAFLRGFVRESLGIAAWAGAGTVAAWGAPSLVPVVRDWVGNDEFAVPIAHAGVFIVALVLFSIGVTMIAGLVRGVGLGAMDRSLGIAFGLARGALLVIAAYLGASYLMPPERWPEPVQQARTLYLVYEGAEWVADLIPPQYRPVVPEPPSGSEPSVADVLHVPAQGRAPLRP